MRVRKLLPRLLFILLVFVAFVTILLATYLYRQAGLPVEPTVPPGAVVVDNQGEICFQIFQNALELDASITPKGCYSSSCTVPIEQSGTVIVDLSAKKINFTSHFVLYDPLEPTPHRCTADCGGGGGIKLSAGDMQPGIYSVYLGSRFVGEVEFPFGYISLGLREGRDLYCLSSEKEPKLVPTVTPTATPRPHPYPYPTADPTWTPPYP